MTDTSRATVTLDRSLMNLVDEIVGVFGATRPQVINNIVELFFNNPKNDILLEKLRLRQRNQNYPEIHTVEINLGEFLQGANKIPLDTLLKYLNIGEPYFWKNNKKWSQKYQYTVEENIIIKNNKTN